MVTWARTLAGASPSGTGTALTRAQDDSAALVRQLLFCCTPNALFSWIFGIPEVALHLQQIVCYSIHLTLLAVNRAVHIAWGSHRDYLYAQVCIWSRLSESRCCYGCSSKVHNALSISSVPQSSCVACNSCCTSSDLWKCIVSGQQIHYSAHNEAIDPRRYKMQRKLPSLHSRFPDSAS